MWSACEKASAAVLNPAQRREQRFPTGKLLCVSHHQTPAGAGSIHGDEVRATISNTGADAADGADAALPQHGGPGTPPYGPERQLHALFWRGLAGALRQPLVAGPQRQREDNVLCALDALAGGSEHQAAAGELISTTSMLRAKDLSQKLAHQQGRSLNRELLGETLQPA